MLMATPFVLEIGDKTDKAQAGQPQIVYSGIAVLQELIATNHLLHRTGALVVGHNLQEMAIGLHRMMHSIREAFLCAVKRATK